MANQLVGARVSLQRTCVMALGHVTSQTIEPLLA